MTETPAPTTTTCETGCSCGCNQVLHTCACHFGETTEPAPIATEPLRCDRCGADPIPDGTRAVHDDGRVLLFCRTHAPIHIPALEKQRRWRIEPVVVPEPSTGPSLRVECGVCGGSAVSRRVTVHASTPVQIVQCIACDTRTCNHVVGKNAKGEPIMCDKRVTDRKDPICSAGHTLMVEAA